jgi:hypothetical protein
MAKVKTIEQVRNDIETEVIERLSELDDYVAERYEIECYDSCLDGAVWNATLKAIVDMYVTAIVNDRDWEGKKFKHAIDISELLKVKALQKQLKKLQRELKELTA